MASSQSNSSSRSSSDSHKSAAYAKPPLVDSEPPPKASAQKSGGFDAERARLAASCDALGEAYRKEERERFQRYQAQFTQELMAKYFSDKDIFGDNIYEQHTLVGGELMKASRWFGMESFADPVKYLELKSKSGLASEADSSASSGKSIKRSG